jgi:hypothetical protein
MKTKSILIIIGSVVAAAVFAFDPPPVGSAAPQAATSRTGSHDSRATFAQENRVQSLSFNAQSGLIEVR